MNPLPWLTEQSALWSQQQNRLSHAYLLAGSSGLGITDFAKQMAKDLLCQQGSFNACQQCQHCNLFDKKKQPDFFHLRVQDDKKEISIAQVRELITKLYATSHQGGYKVALIEEVEKLNTASFNALLKTLEEPAEHTVLILTTHKVNRLPATILSRCRKIDFICPMLPEAMQWLSQALPQADTPLLKKSLRVNWGAPLKAKGWIENKQFEQEAEWQADLKSLTANQQTVSQVVAKWLKFAQPEEVFNYFYLWSISAVRAALYQQKIAYNPNWLLFQKMVLQAQEVWRGNANKELVLESVCLAWLEHQLPDFDVNNKNEENVFNLLKGPLIRGFKV